MFWTIPSTGAYVRLNGATVSSSLFRMGAVTPMVLAGGLADTMPKIFEATNGSTVGAIATGPGAITNVGPDVSRMHARIWYEDDRWLCQGLGSTNGTVVISGENGTAICIEPPRNRRASWADYPPYEIRDGDTLCFGQITKFRVLNVHS